MNQPKNYIRVYNVDAEKLKNAEEKSVLERELIKTNFEPRTNEIVLDLLCIKYGKVGNYNAQLKKGLTNGIMLAKAILILKQGKNVKVDYKISSAKESIMLPQTFINNDILLKQLCQTFDEHNYKRSYTLEEAKKHIQTRFIDDYLEWINGLSFAEFYDRKEQGDFYEYYHLEEGYMDLEIEEMLQAFIRDYGQELQVKSENETDLLEFIRQSEEIITNIGDNARKIKDLSIISAVKVFIRYKQQLGRKDYSIIYECMKKLGLIPIEEDKNRNKDAREKYIDKKCEVARKYGIIMKYPFGFEMWESA